MRRPLQDDFEQGTWSWWDNQGVLLRQIEFDRGLVQHRGGRNTQCNFVSEHDRTGRLDRDMLASLFSGTASISEGEPMLDVLDRAQPWIDRRSNSWNNPSVQLKICDDGASAETR